MPGQRYTTKPSSASQPGQVVITVADKLTLVVSERLLAHQGCDSTLVRAEQRRGACKAVRIGAKISGKDTRAHVREVRKVI
jgi:hypothetical protein